MPQWDWKRELAYLYGPSRNRFGVVEVPPLSFLMIDGHGDPNTSADYRTAVEALYAVAYAAKFALKAQGVEYSVPPLEGLWWAADMAAFALAHKSEWDWTMMILQPPALTAELLERIRVQVAAKKAPPALPRLRLGTYAEGLAVQTLYLGAYADEGPTIAAMHVFIAENAYQLAGKHHEIYLGDPRRSVPEKLKTIIRQPIRPCG